LFAVVTVATVLGPSGAAGNTTSVAGVVDLSVEVVANPAMAGSVVEYESRIHNRGTQVAERANATFVIPAAAVAVDLESQSCTVTGSTRLEPNQAAKDQPWQVNCDLGTLLPGAEKRVAFSVTLGEHGTWTSVVTVSSDVPDLRPFDNRVETPLHVLPRQPGFTPAFQRPGGCNPLGRATA
jgi:hypothetical protein